MTEQKTLGKTHIEITERAMLITRTFDAPRELVFEAFSKCEHLKHWWGPKGWTLSVCEMDFQLGGTWLYCMAGPEGAESWGKTIYTEIVKPERIAGNDYFVNPQGNPTQGAPWWKITTTFTDQDGKTTVYSESEISDPAMLQSIVEMGVVEGTSQTWDRLAEYLETR